MQFDEVAKENYPRILWFCRKRLHDEALAEDCAQETMLRAFIGWHAFKGDSLASTWLHSIATNVMHTVRAYQMKRSFVQFTADELDKTDDGTPETLLQAKQTALNMCAQIGRLRPNSQAILSLHMDGLTGDQIADAVNCPLGTVKSTIHKSKKRMGLL